MWYLVYGVLNKSVHQMRTAVLYFRLTYPITKKESVSLTPITKRYNLWQLIHYTYRQQTTKQWTGDNWKPNHKYCRVAATLVSHFNSESTVDKKGQLIVSPFVDVANQVDVPVWFRQLILLLCARPPIARHSGRCQMNCTIWRDCNYLNMTNDVYTTDEKCATWCRNGISSIKSDSCSCSLPPDHSNLSHPIRSVPFIGRHKVIRTSYFW